MATQSVRIEWDRRALDQLYRGPLVEQALRVAGDDVRDGARANAQPISASLADAIWTDEPTEDAEGPYIDVGYNKQRPGWVLWFHEVGTINHPARPHLRPAVRPS